jgi:mRNA-degrading endonuclease RelE of RelBE toxin-antitoxin system
MYEIEMAPEAQQDFNSFRKVEQTRIRAAIEAQLRHQPNVATRNRKRMRPHYLTEWELRIGDFRVFYDVQPQVLLVRVAAIGQKKGNRLFFRGQEYLP